MEQTLHLHKKVVTKLQTNAEVYPGHSILVACSGGGDSVALAHVLLELGYAVSLAHVNYHLRGQDSEEDEELVKRLAKEWGIPVHIKSAKSLGLDDESSIQMQARAIFESLMDQYGYAFCATAHHLGDQAETLLMSLLRSQESRLWHGIPFSRDRYVRPLLDTSKAELVAYLQEQQLEYREDQSNFSTKYLRNKVRWKVLPSLSSIHPQVEQHLSQRYSWYQTQHAFIQQVLRPFMPKEGHRTLIWTAFTEQWGQEYLPLLVGETLSSWGFKGIQQQEGIRLISSEPGHYLETAQGRLYRVRHGLQLLVQSSQNPEEMILEEVPTQEIIWGPWSLRFKLLTNAAWAPGQIMMDYDRIAWPIVLRSWKEGDRMQPFGMKGSKLLSDIFIDLKLSPIQKQEALVLADQKGPIWVSNYRISERMRVSSNSQRQLLLSISNPSQKD